MLVLKLVLCFSLIAFKVGMFYYYKNFYFTEESNFDFFHLLVDCSSSLPIQETEEPQFTEYDKNLLKSCDILLDFEQHPVIEKHPLLKEIWKERHTNRVRYLPARVILRCCKDVETDEKKTLECLRNYIAPYRGLQ